MTCGQTSVEPARLLNSRKAATDRTSFDEQIDRAPAAEEATNPQPTGIALSAPRRMPVESHRRDPLATTYGEPDVEAAVVAKLRALPPERRRKVLAFAESLA